MKRTRIIFLWLFALLLAGCKKESGAGSPPAADFTPYLKGKLDGSPFNSTLYLFAIGVATGADLHLSGVYANGSVAMTIKAFNNMPGERLTNENNSIGITYSGAFFYAGSIVTGNPVQGNGKITILEVTDKFVKGTFECVAPIDPAYGVFNPPLTITEGEFKLKRQP